MLLTYDLDRAKWVTAPGTASPPAKPHFIRRDTPPISVQFCRGATVVEVGVAPTWRFGIKALGGFSGRAT